MVNVIHKKPTLALIVKYQLITANKVKTDKNKKYFI